MAGPYIGTFYFKNGRQLSFYQAANCAVGTILPCEVYGVSASTSATEFIVPPGEIWEVDDMITGNSAGQCQVFRDNFPTGKYFATDATRASTAGNVRPKIPMTFIPGHRYKFVQSVTGAA